MADHTKLMQRAADELEQQAAIYKSTQTGVKNWHRPEVRAEHERLVKLVAELRAALGVRGSDGETFSRKTPMPDPSGSHKGEPSTLEPTAP